ncbi:LOW QUALITY PROTEIN: protein ECT2 [Drosophila gunungcola]|uniref:LOW QUALITY PROTEIN: protein ECT2 n=1 Tax=Drosophila gunungcola TaxID=103775 RepID=UPI0022E2E64B|nr:LOW QUALITY PROTEIN: protein ECT2 [Drosophila gunungcola]
MLHLPLVQFNFGTHLGKKSSKLVTVQRQSASYFTYAAAEEVKQAKLRQAALCQVYEDFTEMSITALPTRICLVGGVGQDADTLRAAESFGMPIVTSDTGLEIIGESDWRTFYVLDDFEGASFEAIHKQKECILGPPALKYAAEMKQTLGQNSRPIYNYAMRGVVTCFTGIRKKDELTKLVNLIHSMGGCIKKDLNTKTTHLICNHSGGEKYQYAKTFRLTVVRPAWVFAAWADRNSLELDATQEIFTKAHRLKAFEGQKICFFGFPAEEHQHMVDVLLENGGVCAELEDPECSHVVMPNTGAVFTSTSTSTDTNPSTQTNPTESQIPGSSASQAEGEEEQQAKDLEQAEIKREDQSQTEANNAMALDVDPEQEQKENQAIEDEDDIHFDERLFVEAADIRNPGDDQLPESDEEDLVEEQKPKVKEMIEEQDEQEDVQASTPKSSKIRTSLKAATPLSSPEMDGNPLDFESTTQNISPILKAIDECDLETDDLPASENDLKRKRDSFDNVSLMSVDSFALPTSTKKPKLIRTGSISRTLRRSVSFVAEPLMKTLRPRRSSVADASSFIGSEAADNSISSLASSINLTLNESIRKPVKEKLRSFCGRITRSSSRRTDRGVDGTPECSTILDSGFKTPKAPKLRSTATPKTAKRLFGPVSGVVSSLTLTNPSTPTPTLHPTPNPNPTVSLDVNDTSTHTFAFCAAAVTPAMPPSSSSSSSPILSTSTAVHSSVQVIKSPEESTARHQSPGPIEEPMPMVVDEHTTVSKPEPKNNHTHILKSDWFWYTIQNGYANEMDYLFGDYLDSITNTPNTDRRDSLPISFNKRKRKRFSQRIQLEGTPLGSGKRRSSVSDAGLLSVSNSFFDCTTSPDKLEAEKLLHAEPEASETTPAKKSMRFNHFMDFFTTESNYVGILDTILNLFKNKLEELAETNDPLLNKSEIKTIFGNFLPIHEVHQSMLEHLRKLHANWREDCLIGDIIIQHRDELIKAYPPYVNFFEQMKEQLQYCDREYPRFHAFLKINQTKPECGRQGLQDLMIRPVQRLPSISLLLNDILKHTAGSNADHGRLEEALKAIKQVTLHINEDKRRTESRMAIFDIFNDIDGCPAHLVSSNRSFILKCEVNELSDSLSGRGDSLVLYLFSDSIELCKRRSRGFNTAKSPSTAKTHKHLKLISLNTIRLVIDISDSPRAFGLLLRGEKEKLYTFTISDEETDKSVYVKKLCNQIAAHTCRTDADKLLICRTSQELEVDISDVNVSTLSKAFKLAAKTRLKVGRAFSFNKTPNKLKRAVSTMMTSPFGSTNSLTPASQLAQMRLASCTNINEVDDEDCASMRSSSPSTQSEMLVVPPLSVQPTRKNKAVVGRI